MATTPTLQERRRAAIQSIESRGSGGYSAIGPYNEKLGRALGAYQIMEANIPQWSQEALGRKVSSMEFLKSPEIQDAIFDYKFGNYAKKYGEQGAAEAWFAGPGGVGKSGRKDVLGTTVGGYGQRYLDALTGGGAALPREMFEPGASEYRSQIPAQIPLVELTPIQQRARSIFGDQVAATPTGNMSVQERARAIFGTPQQAPAYTPGVSGPVVPTIAYGTGAGETPYPVAAPEGAFDITRSMSSEYTPILGDVARSLTGQGPSPGASMLPEETPLRGAVGRVIDVGLGAASGLGAGMSGAAGLVGDVARGLGMETGRAERLATDVMAMPEAFAGSIGSISQPTRGARITASVPAPTRENAATLAQQAREGLRGAREAAEANVQRAMGQGPTPAQQGLQQAAQEVAGEIPPAAKSVAKSQTRLGKLISKAETNNRSAMEQLAKDAKIDPEAARIAEELGIKVPFDVLSDDKLITEVTGMMRSARGTDEALAWQDDIENASKRAFEVMRGESNYSSLSDESDRIRRALDDSVRSLRETGGGLLEEVKDAVPSHLRVHANETTKAINKLITDLGGVQELTAPERRLFRALTSDEGITYRKLQRIKEAIGDAAFEGKGEFVTADKAALRSYYQALKQDQRNFIEGTLDAEALTKFDRGNELWSKSEEVKDRLIEGFGKNLDGSISTLLRDVVAKGKGGDITHLNKAIRVIPEGMRKDAIMSAVDTLSRSTTGPNAGTGFSFQNYQKLYEALRSQGPVFSGIAKELGPETVQRLQDLYTLSKRISRAQDAVKPGTGAGLHAYFVDGLMTRFLESAPGKLAQKAALGPAGTAVDLLKSVEGSARQRRIDLAGQLFRSDEFGKVVSEATASGRVSPENAQRLIKSPGYKAWAKSVQIKDPEAWLMEAIAAQQAAQGARE